MSSASKHLTIDLTVSCEYFWKRKHSHAIAKNIHYGAILCFIEFYHENDNYFTRFTIPAIYGIKTRSFAPKTNTGIRPKPNTVCSLVTQSCSTDAVNSNFLELLSYEHTAEPLLFFMDYSLPLQQ